MSKISVPISYPSGGPAKGRRVAWEPQLLPYGPTSPLVSPTLLPANGWALQYGYSAGPSCLTQAATNRQPRSSGAPVGLAKMHCCLRLFLPNSLCPFTGVRLALRSEGSPCHFLPPPLSPSQTFLSINLLHILAHLGLCFLDDPHRHDF